jgi:NAD(P)-dependent dehydrogenase (short-subunit alcohol dehydrogenase family)
VTGGAGFIGGNFVLEAVQRGVRIINLDVLTYAGNLDTLSSLDGHPAHVFLKGDIGDAGLVERLLREHRPDAVINFAAESHVDRSIDGPAAFVQTNVVGTLALLEKNPRLLEVARCTGTRCLPLPACLHRRGLRFAGRHRQVHRKPHRIAPNSRIPHRRPRPTTWRARSTIPTACRS